MAFINQPVEVAGVRRQFASFLGIGDRRPDLVLRIGRGPDAHRSSTVREAHPSRPFVRVDALLWPALS